jgi:AcrR family transcriptional regulator
MTQARPRTKPSVERRDDLMNAAERLFLDHGFDRTTVEDITRGADVAKGTFYLQFSSKTDILDALRQRFVQTLLDAVKGAVATCDTGDAHGRLATWARHCAIGYLETARLHHLVFVAAPPPSREGLARNPLVDELALLLKHGNALGGWTVENPHLTAVLLFNALHGAVNEPGLEEPAARANLLDALEAHFLRAVGVNGPIPPRS